MSVKRELVLRITPDERSIRVEEMKDGVTSFKEIALETFYDCVRYSIRHEGVQSGFLPQNCFHVSVSENGDRDFCLWHPHLHADINYFGTEYLDFPLPRLVFGFRVSQEGKVGTFLASAGAAVITPQRRFTRAPQGSPQVFRRP